MNDNINIETSCLRNDRGELIRHLTIDHVIWMSNDNIEYKDIDRALETAHGDCYIGGLGLGIIVKECLKRAAIKHVTVVEINPKIVELVCPILELSKVSQDHWSGPNIDVFIGDATTDFKNKKYDWMYFDVWLEPDDEGKRLMHLCFENAKNFLKENGVLEAWLKPRLE